MNLILIDQTNCTDEQTDILLDKLGEYGRKSWFGSQGSARKYEQVYYDSKRTNPYTGLGPRDEIHYYSKHHILTNHNEIRDRTIISYTDFMVLEIHLVKNNNLNLEIIIDYLRSIERSSKNIKMNII